MTEPTYVYWIQVDGIDGDHELVPFATEEEARAHLGDRLGDVWRALLPVGIGEIVPPAG
jgi:hypothetical protein